MTAVEIIEQLPSPRVFYAAYYTKDGGAVRFYDGNEIDKYNSGVSNTLADVVGGMKLAAKYGGEGKGESHWFVIYFEEHDVYLRADGYYTSNWGSNYDDSEWHEVKPITKTITVYE